MYCRKCGKFIDYDAPICKECQAEEVATAKVKEEVKKDNLDLFESAPANQTIPAQTDVSANSGLKKAGFGGALTSTILGSIATILSIVALAYAMVVLEEFAMYGGYGYNSYYSENNAIATIGIALSLICLGLAIPSLILGIKSIKCFKRTNAQYKVKPVGTLVCGIIGLVCAAEAILSGFISLCVCVLI